MNLLYDVIPAQAESFFLYFHEILDSRFRGSDIS